MTVIADIHSVKRTFAKITRTISASFATVLILCASIELFFAICHPLGVLAVGAPLVGVGVLTILRFGISAVPAVILAQWWVLSCTGNGSHTLLQIPDITSSWPAFLLVAVAYGWMCWVMADRAHLLPKDIMRDKPDWRRVAGKLALISFGLSTAGVLALALALGWAADITASRLARLFLWWVGDGSSAALASLCYVLFKVRSLRTPQQRASVEAGLVFAVVFIVSASAQRLICNYHIFAVHSQVEAAQNALDLLDTRVTASGHHMTWHEAGGQLLAERHSGKKDEVLRTSVPFPTHLVWLMQKELFPGFQPSPQRDALLQLAQEATYPVGTLRIGDLTGAVLLAPSVVMVLADPGWWAVQLLPFVVGILLLIAATRDVFQGFDHQQEKQRSSDLLNYLQNVSEPNHKVLPYAKEISEGWQKREFIPKFEPIIDLRNGELRGVEMLLRWHQSPPGCHPGHVIDWAEHNKVISDLDFYMLRAALADAAKWPLRSSQPFTMAINASATDICRPNWAQSILQLLDGFGFSPRHLCVELTEGLLVNPGDAVLEQLLDIREAGVCIAMDDFGTGYSSIASLQQLPIDRLKLDRALIKGLISNVRVQHVVRHVVQMALALEIEVVAEGIEDQVTRELLAKMGCNFGQGFLFSRAMDAKVVDSWLVAGVGPWQRQRLSHTT